MKVEDLRKVVADADAAGHASIVLAVYRKTPPSGERLRVMPGVMGRFACWNQDARGTFAACYVETSDLRAALAKIDSAS